MRLQAAGNELVVASAGYALGGMDPDITVLSNGQMVVTWSEVLEAPSDESDDVDGGVFARILDSDGVPVSEIFQVSEFSSYPPDFGLFPQTGPQVVALAAGSFGIGWTHAATFGDDSGVSDYDSFIRFFDGNGTPFGDFLIDYHQDTPPFLEAGDQVLREIVKLSGGRFAAIVEDANIGYYHTKVYDSSGQVETFIEVAVDDMVQLENGNIVFAGIAADNTISLTMTDRRFDPPKNIAGIYDRLTFSIGTPLGAEKSEVDLELAALSGGGFALAYSELVDAFSSQINIAIISDEAVHEFSADPIVREIPVQDQLGTFDMIGLSRGGFALAVTRLDALGGTTGVDIMLYDENGRVQTTLGVGASDIGDQANPTLTELPGGRIALAYTDTSGNGDAGDHNTLRMAFFELKGKAGRFVGSDGDDLLRGLGGHDRIFGFAGDDQIEGKGGADRLFGGEGNDAVLGGTGNDALRGGDGNDTLNGNGGRDGVGGGAGNDVVKGGMGNDVVGGGAGSDRVFGGAGDDHVRGGLGDDALWGGAGADIFHFARSQSGDDHINDFNNALDILSIDLRGAKRGIVDVEIVDGDTVVSYGTSSVTLDGVALDQGDIMFNYV